MPIAAVKCLREPAQVAALLDPTRQLILARLGQPDSAAGLARTLDQPRQRLNYHLRELEKAGLVELYEQRRRGNCVERVMRAVARSYVIAPEVLGSLFADPDQPPAEGTPDTLLALAGRVFNDVAELSEAGDAAGERAATVAATAEIRFARPEDRDAFAEDVQHEVAALIREYHDESGPEAYTIFMGAYPVRDGA
ncbi:MAG: helix-turn-helix transcriptional regulator [Planctomycetes bacterium]|nr:helix-turn-helix transcriptional regulator [Planctomycetota bacterium]